MRTGHDFLRLKGAKTNNLKNIDVDIPLKKFTVVTGLSGSGKSSLVFDTLYAEGQRRYVESLSTYTRQFLEKMPKPEIDSIENISPSIALEQKNHINNSRSTVATMSEIYDYLRILFARIGQTFCIKCGKQVRSDNSQLVVNDLIAEGRSVKLYVLAAIDEKLIEKKQLQDSLKFWASQGLSRLVISTKAEEEVVELSTIKSIPSKAERVALVIDRLSFSADADEDSKTRFSEAVDQAFSHGMGKMFLGIVESGKSNWEWRSYSTQFRCEPCNIDYKKPEPNHFSFNNPLGACPGCSGFGYNLELDENLIVPDKRKTLKNGAVDPFTKPAYQEWHRDLLKFCEKNGISIGKRYEDLTKEEKSLLWKGDGSKRGFQGIEGCFEELKEWKYKLYVRVFIRRYQSPRLCLECNGSRLNVNARAVRIGSGEQQASIDKVVALSIERANQYFKDLNLSKSDLKVAKDALSQVRGRLEFLDGVGVGYLTLNRQAKTLSGGECQRINLATQLGNKLCSTLYVLDEPSIGLHAADTEKMISLLHKLRDHGNTVVVVEHDLDVISSADYLVEIGPFAGHRGGELVASGTLDEVKQSKVCLTAKYLTKTFSIPIPKLRREGNSKSVKITGACENNLRDVDVEFPLHKLVAITGLSGSGKTTLVHKTLYNALHRLFHKENVEVGKFQRLYGVDQITDIVLLDQKPIGRSARSNPATYLKIYDDVRKVMSNQSGAIRKGFTPQYFSFNVDGGRCPVCKGEGEVTLDMHFMSDLKLPCEECDGKKFTKTVLEVEFKKKNIHQILNTTIDECVELFREYPAITSKLQVLRSVGLGYLNLGQSSSTMSGGESQRLKVASVLSGSKTNNVIYIFDEPTTGLHVDDVKKLVSVMHDLVDQKNTVIAIEHNLDLIAQADWIIDVGPGGGEHGGKIVACGTPEQLVEIPESLTGVHLKRILN